MYILSGGLASNDGDDITYSSLTMRALQWSFDSLQTGLGTIALPTYLVCSQKRLLQISLLFQVIFSIPQNTSYE